ncbi:putative N-acetyltransferase YafP [Polystyrenella longa]|uniref:Putative N-acetyltransferase YafP n=1 Tax=Polystyrenella longa TaxID=2528007 RepID=A0A518CJS9_9PLAN|nr:GNAT family N-acetyltransferase [Polystyrenella longa]QDU79489.1 putative N-acetyltransferase YafP [Polystyrenella longa]
MMPPDNSPHIRFAKPEDGQAIAHLFYDTVHEVNCRDYNIEQVDAWAPHREDTAKWIARQKQFTTFVVEREGQIAGFAELDLLANPGRIDCFYVHKDFQRTGSGSLLMSQLKTTAVDSGIRTLTAEVSITALPFFQRHQFEIIQKQEVTRQNVLFINYLMKCPLK